MKQIKFPSVIGVFFLIGLMIFSSACPQSSTPANQAVNKEPEKITENKVTFLAVGDMMISRGVARAIDRAGTPLAPFEKMKDVFLSTDFNFGNLECPISGRENVVGKGLVFNMRTKDLEGLKKYNFKVINFANNHAMDMGVNGLKNTHKVLDENGFTRLGTGENLDEAWTPKIYEVKGVKIGFVGVSYVSINDGSGAARNDYVARMEDKDRVKKAIEQLKHKARILSSRQCTPELNINADRINRRSISPKTRSITAQIWSSERIRIGCRFLSNTKANIFFIRSETSSSTKLGAATRWKVWR